MGVLWLGWFRLQSDGCGTGTRLGEFSVDFVPGLIIMLPS